MTEQQRSDADETVDTVTVYRPVKKPGFPKGARKADFWVTTLFVLKVEMDTCHHLNQYRMCHGILEKECNDDLLRATRSLRWLVSWLQNVSTFVSQYNHSLALGDRLYLSYRCKYHFLILTKIAKRMYKGTVSGNLVWELASSVS